MKHVLKLSAFISLLSGSPLLGASLKPVLLLENRIRVPDSLNNLQDYRGSNLSKGDRDKAIKDFKASIAKLQKGGAAAKTEIEPARRTANRLGIKAKLLVELNAARVLAGLSTNGGKVSAPSANYRSALLTATNLAAKIDEKTHEQTAVYAVTLWRKVESASSPWTSPPLDVKAQKQFPISKSLSERQAIYEWDKGMKSAAIKKYRVLSAHFQGKNEANSLDLRILDLEKKLYQDSKSVKAYQSALVEMSTKYKDTESPVKTTAQSHHRDLINNLIRAALKKNASDLEHKSAVNGISVYVDSGITDDEKFRVRSSLGEIYFAAGQHKSATNAFAGLASESQPPKSDGYWRLAIRSQIVLAKWSSDAPWFSLTAGDLSQREVLLDMYRKIDKQQAQDWPTAAHIGLLLVTNARPEEANQFWNERITKFPQGLHASKAAGWLTQFRIEQKKWSDLEALGRILVEHGLAGVTKQKTWRPREVLGIALLEGGLAAFSSSDFKTAVTKLGEYVKGWRGDSRHDEGYFILAKSYQGDRQFSFAVQALEGYVKLYPKSKFRQEALVLGSDWTLNLAWEEHAIFFLETHAKEFSSSESSKNSLATLTDLYLGREIYDQAMRVFSIQLDRKDLDRSTKTDLAKRLVSTAERHASESKAIKVSDKIASQFREEQEIHALALSLKARILSKKWQVAPLMKIEKQVAGLDQSNSVISDITGEVHFLVAEALAHDQFKEEVFSLELKDPKAQLEKGYAHLVRINEAYSQTCSGARSGWCGPAYHRSARVCEDFVKAYADIDIAKTLEPEIVKQFRNRKKEILDGVRGLVRTNDQKSVEQARSGATNPDWTAAILWQNDGDWSPYKFTSESASHFIQWKSP